MPWQEDETVSSLASRLHQLWGHPLAAQTAQILFGAPQGGTLHDLTTHLSAFETATGGQLGIAAQLAETRTLARFYRSFLGPDDAESLSAALCGSSLAHVKLRLGILTSRFRAHHPLKACPACIAEGQASVGFSWWRLTHQYPGVWVCPKHHVLLRESVMKSSGVARFQWVRPSLAAFRDWPDVHGARGVGMSDASRAALRQLAHTIVDLVDATQGQPLLPLDLIQAYRAALASRGWVTSAGNLRLSRIAASYLAYVAPLRVVPELSGLPASPEEAQTQLGRLLRAPVPGRVGTHPLRHCLLVDWLFGGAGPFLRDCKALQHRGSDFLAIADPCVPLVLPTTQHSKRVIPEAELHRLLVDEQYSLRKTAERLGVDVSTVMVWATRCDLAFGRRPKLIRDEIRESLIAALYEGIDKQEAAARFGISIVSVTRTLRTEPGLQQKWHETRALRARDEARARWRALLAEHGALGTKYLRSLAPAAYAWLYRNDREWLQQNRAAVFAPITVRASSVQWDVRDKTLSAQVQEAALSVAQERPGRCIHLWQLYQRVPELRAKLSALELLPLTRRAIDLAIHPAAAVGGLFSD